MRAFTRGRSLRVYTREEGCGGEQKREDCEYGVCGLCGEKKTREKRGRNESYDTDKTGQESETTELANMMKIERKRRGEKSGN